jgi:hypothetical protein
MLTVTVIGGKLDPAGRLSNRPQSGGELFRKHSHPGPDMAMTAIPAGALS